MVLIRYNENTCETLQPSSAEEALAAFSDGSVNWLNLDNRNHELLQAIGEGCSLHHMLIGDILDAKHLPKFEDFDHYCFLSLKMLTLDPQTNNLVEEQLSIVLSNRFVITVQEDQQRDVFDPVRERIVHHLGRIRKMGGDYLVYRLLDAVVSEYMTILEYFRDRIELLEERVVKHPEADVFGQVVRLKKQVGIVRKYTLPLKEELMYLKSGEIAFVQRSTRTYLRDVFDNLVYLSTSFESFRDMLRDLMELQIAAVNHSTNGIMKTLTVISSVFIPLTFIVGIYGMNFENMPELQMRWGYPVVMGTILAIAIGMWVYMRHRKWV